MLTRSRGGSPKATWSTTCPLVRDQSMQRDACISPWRSSRQSSAPSSRFLLHRPPLFDFFVQGEIPRSPPPFPHFVRSFSPSESRAQARHRHGCLFSNHFTILLIPPYTSHQSSINCTRTFSSRSSTIPDLWLVAQGTKEAAAMVAMVAIPKLPVTPSPLLNKAREKGTRRPSLAGVAIFLDASELLDGENASLPLKLDAAGLHHLRACVPGQPHLLCSLRHIVCSRVVHAV
ncbi:hypothetical protein PVAP13_2NG135100 [Panicum virgatum]|nr:hypothetical protein PVAP13_2NG135100 [Panicum virgatum]KAG2632695.1 hypothetical protein PVAP13_2NG135100 [Panicum virgatum]